ncbi:MAG: hypothetical protein J6X55_08595, partial [Victivallales bacterium]|nr:hypothetical protein [Victivallales bacterium]
MLNLSRNIPNFIRVGCFVCILLFSCAVGEETPKERLKRYLDYGAMFKSELIKQKLVEYPGSKKNGKDEVPLWENMTSEQIRKFIRKFILRAYPVCWSFDRFTSGSYPIPSLEIKDQGCTFMLVESNVRLAGSKYAESHPKIVFPDEIFPMGLLKDKAKIAKELDIEDPSKIYCLLVTRCGSMNLWEFYSSNFEFFLKGKVKAQKDLMKSAKSDNDRLTAKAKKKVKDVKDDKPPVDAEEKPKKDDGDDNDDDDD